MRISSPLVLLISALLPAIFSLPVVPRDHVAITKRPSSLAPASSQQDYAVPSATGHQQLFNSWSPRDLDEVYPRGYKSSKGSSRGGRSRSSSKGSSSGKIRSSSYKSSSSGRSRSASPERSSGGKSRSASPNRSSNGKSKSGTSSKRRSNTKVTFGDAAKAKLDELGLHGKARKNVKNYHKNVVKQDMKNHGAGSARIFHLAHPGGSDPNERNHITAGYYKKSPAKGKPGEQIKSPWSKKYEAQNPGKTSKGLFHVYPEDHGRKAPSSWTKAVGESAGRKKEAEAKAKAEDAAAAKAKADLAHQHKQAGQSLSAEEKQAQRKAAKEAKALKRKGGK